MFIHSDHLDVEIGSVANVWAWDDKFDRHIAVQWQRETWLSLLQLHCQCQSFLEFAANGFACFQLSVRYKHNQSE